MLCAHPSIHSLTPPPIPLGSHGNCTVLALRSAAVSTTLCGRPTPRRKLKKNAKQAASNLCDAAIIPLSSSFAHFVFLFLPPSILPFSKTFCGRVWDDQYGQKHNIQ